MFVESLEREGVCGISGTSANVTQNAVFNQASNIFYTNAGVGANSGGTLGIYFQFNTTNDRIALRVNKNQLKNWLGI